MKRLELKKVIIWIAIGISALFANFWAYWGINENFHEGWYFESLKDNIIMMFGQYMLMPIGFMLLSYISIRWNRVGSLLFWILAVGSFFLFGGMDTGFFMVSLPLAGLGLLYWFGRLDKGRRLAYALVLGLPLVLILGIGTYHIIRVTGRYDDHQFGARVVQGNGVKLVWAPQGPGWPDKGTTWFEANEICAHLNRDGTELENEELNIWRLPTADEAVRSMVRHGENAGGVWNEAEKKPEYRIQPDKESPLWNCHLKTIYWWTSTPVDELSAYMIVYNGGVWPRRKTLKADYLNFRAVKAVESPAEE